MEPMTIRAERAALGSMLQERGIRGPVGSFLDPGHFLALPHREMFGAIMAADTSRGMPWRQAVAEAARTTAPGITPRYMDELVRACPDRMHGLEYARMVMEAAALRTLIEDADAIAERAGSVGDLAARLRQAQSPGALVVGDLAGFTGKAEQLIRAHAVRFTPDTTPGIAVPLIASGPQAEREETVVGTLIRGHSQAADILARVSPDAFADPVRKEIYAAAANMYQQGFRVDPVTLDWELTMTGAPGLVPQSELAMRLDHRDSYVTRLASAVPAQPVEQAIRELVQAAQEHPSRQHPSRPGPGRPQVVPGQVVPSPLARPGNGHAPVTGLIPPGQPQPGGRVQGR